MHTADHGGDLCSMVPLLARRVPGLRPTVSTTPEADRGRLAMAAIGLLEAGARNRPIVVVLDDLHWADSGTVGLLRGSYIEHRACRCSWWRRIAARTWTESSPPPGCSPTCDARLALLAFRLSACPRARCPGSFAVWLAGRSMTRLRRSRRRCVATPTATRFSSSRCCTTSWKPARWSWATATGP